jgi:hypothetical protein
MQYPIMFIVMIMSGLLSTMNVWVDKYEDIRFSINDAYMTLLMTGWMFLFMGLIYRDFTVFAVGLAFVVINIWCIRTQFLVTDSQYKQGMIPHHSMAIHMSKQLLQKGTALKPFATNLINVQRNEIISLNTPTF